MICSLCLKEISVHEESVVVDDAIRHKTCSEELENMVKELERIYEETAPEGI